MAQIMEHHGNEQIRPDLCAVSSREVLQLVHSDLPLTVPHQNTVCLRGEQQSRRIYSRTGHAHNRRVQTVKQNGVHCKLLDRKTEHQK